MPTMYLKGYDVGDSAAARNTKRKAPIDRKIPEEPRPKRKKQIPESNSIISKPVSSTINSTIIDFQLTTTSSCLVSPQSSTTPSFLNSTLVSPHSSTNPSFLNSTLVLCQPSMSALEKPLKINLTWSDVKDTKRMVKVYTGCSTKKIFMFIVDHVRPKHTKLHYFKSTSSAIEEKQYQISPIKLYCQRKPGPCRRLSLEDEIIMTLMRIRLDAPVEDLAFRFGISPAPTSNIITTFLIFLSLELKPLIYWPTPEETMSYQHSHFSGTFNKVEGIGDCTEQWIQRSKNVDAQYQTYSTYKSHNTLKKLIFCTKSGSISYISEAYGGSSSDRFITEDTNVASKFTPGFIAMFDKGFNVQDLFLVNQVKCVLPPFVRRKRKFTRSEVYHGKRIARARIHIERVMGRLKEFRLLNNTLPISMLDLCDHIWNIAGAVTNMQPPLVKLNQKQ